MTVKTNYGAYPEGNKDAVENFHGNQLVYFAWDDHLGLGTAFAFPFPPEMPFAAITGEVLPNVCGAHPDFENIDWVTATWILDGENFIPDLGKSLAENGIGHKSLIRLKTPGLKGYKGSGS